MKRTSASVKRPAVDLGTRKARNDFHRHELELRGGVAVAGWHRAHNGAHKVAVGRAGEHGVLRRVLAWPRRWRHFDVLRADDIESVIVGEVAA